MKDYTFVKSLFYLHHCGYRLLIRNITNKVVLSAFERTESVHDMNTGEREPVNWIDLY